MAETFYYLAARSDKTLKNVCRQIRDRYNLPRFDFDHEDNWDYAVSATAEVSFNVTKADDETTIPSWISGTPTGVNFQIIVGVPASDLRLGRDWENELVAFIGAPVVCFAVKRVS